MWPKGFQIKWFRNSLLQKAGSPKPHRPGFGPTELQVMQNSNGFYVGTGYILPDGSEKPYTIEGDYFVTREEAMDMLERMTGKMNEKLLRKYIQMTLAEARRADKEGVELPTLENELQSYADGNSSEKPEYYITFTAINKVGVNPGSDYNTPAGIYAYPLFPKTVQQLTSPKGSERLPFATQQPFISILKTSAGANLVTSPEFTLSEQYDAMKQLYTQETVERFGLSGTSFEDEVQKVEEAVAQGINPITAIMRNSAIYEEAQKKARKRPIDLIWLLTKMIAGGSPGAGDKAAAPIGKWNAILRGIGMDAFYDRSTGLIHKNEPQQAIFLSKGAVDVVKTFPNTLTPEHMRTRAKQAGEW